MCEVLESNDISVKRGRGRPKKIIETETEPIVINSSSEMKKQSMKDEEGDQELIILVRVESLKEEKNISESITHLK